MVDTIIVSTNEEIEAQKALVTGSSQVTQVMEPRNMFDVAVDILGFLYELVILCLVEIFKLN